MRVKLLSVIVCIVIISSLFFGCTAKQEKTMLFDNKAVSIERTEDIITVTEKETDTQYRFTVKRQLVKKDSKPKHSEAKPLHDSDTVTIDTVFNILIVTDKTENKIYYVKTR